MVILSGRAAGLPYRQKMTGNIFPVSGFYLVGMQRSIAIGLCLIVCAAILCAGCTSSSGTGSAATTGTATTTPTTNVSLAPLALTPTNVPAGYTLVSSRQKSSDEMSSVAKDLGWQEGYVTIYSSPAGSAGKPTTITQTITVYSGKDISSIVSLVDKNERQQNGLVFSDLALPATGADTRAFSAALVNATPTVTPGGMVTLAESSGTTPTVGYTEVIFGKGEILEVIRMSGPGAQYDTLKSLAEMAYAKLG
jgi:hypothetical protein